MTTLALSISLLRDLYTRMLLTRLVDENILRLHANGYGDFVASCRGHEAAQIGTAACIEIGKDFTLPYYRDLGVVLTIGMTPYEVFRTYLQMRSLPESNASTTKLPARREQTLPHWGYHKHNTVTGAAPVATQILHAAGIAFASKLRKTDVATIAYCGDGATNESDFLEGVRFASQHQLPALFICEQDCTSDTSSMISQLEQTQAAGGMTYHHLDGSDILTVYTTMQAALHAVRTGQGPILLELCVTRSAPGNEPPENDPLILCQAHLQCAGGWDPHWASQLVQSLTSEVERALRNALDDTFEQATSHVIR